MSNDKRERCIRFCVSTTAYLRGIGEEDVREMEFIVMTDSELLREADWLDYMLGK